MTKRALAIAGLVAFSFYVVNHLRANRDAALENLAASAPQTSPRPKTQTSPLLQFRSVKALTVPAQDAAYVYDQISQDGRLYTVISAYTNPAGRAGATLTVDVKTLLQKVLADPKAQRLTVNYQMDDQPFSGVYTKSQLSEVLASLERP